MRSLRLVLALFAATAWGMGCGGPSSLKPDSGGGAPDPATGGGSDAEAVVDANPPWTLPEALADSPAGEATEAGPALDGLSGDAVQPDSAGLDAPAPALDAPASTADAAGKDAAKRDARDGGFRDTRDAVSRDGVSERARRDSLPEPPADAAGDTPANLVVPELDGTVYSFRFGETEFAVDAAQGARIVTFAMGGHNVLTAARSASDINWGSTFWPSPQNDWSWPPPTEIDSGPYSASVEGATLVLTGATANALGISVSKAFTVDREAGVVTIEYRISNRGTRSRAVAPWEISRVAAGGLTFFPMGEGTPRKGAQPLLPLEMLSGVAWLTYDPDVITGEAKAFADGSEGWIAHTCGDLLFVKDFGDITPTQAAPGEAEIELYTDPTQFYMEVENQGALASLAAGASRTWTVRWFLRELEASIVIEPGSAELLNTVRALVAK